MNTTLNTVRRVLRYIIVVSLLAFTASTSIVYAGPGGDVVGNGLVEKAKKPINKAQAKVYSLKHIKAQVKAKKHTPDWIKAKFVSAKPATVRKKKAWVVIYTGAKAKKLYVLLSVRGELIDANSTGK